MKGARRGDEENEPRAAQAHAHAPCCSARPARAGSRAAAACGWGRENSCVGAGASKQRGWRTPPPAPRGAPPLSRRLSSPTTNALLQVLLRQVLKIALGVGRRARGLDRHLAALALDVHLALQLALLAVHLDRPAQKRLLREGRRVAARVRASRGGGGGGARRRSRRRDRAPLGPPLLSPALSLSLHLPSLSRTHKVARLQQLVLLCNGQVNHILVLLRRLDRRLGHDGLGSLGGRGGRGRLRGGEAESFIRGGKRET